MKLTYPVLKSRFVPAFIREQSLSAAKRVNKVDAEASQNGNTIESLLPVWLPDDRYSEFRHHFHPRKKNESEGRTTRFSDMYIDMANYFYALSVWLESIYEGMATLMLDYEYIKGLDIGAHITRVIENRHSTNTEEAVGENMSAKEKRQLAKNSSRIGSVHNYIRSMASGGQHIIQNSQRYKGGKDVLFCGFRGVTQSAIMYAKVNDRAMPIIGSSPSARRAQANENEQVIKALIETGQLMFETLFAQRATKAFAYRRISVQHAIGWNPVKDIERIFQKGPLARAGVVITLPEFSATLMHETLKFLAPYNEILAVYEPHPVAVNHKVNHDGPDDSMDVYVPSMVLSPEIRFSFALNIPQDFCEFITQTKDKQIPIAPLSIWASTWAASMMRIPNAKSGYPPPHRAPTYALLPSKLAEVRERRKQLGLYAEPGRNNEDNLFISGNGDLHYLPKSDAASNDNAKAYEALLERSLQLSFDAGVPLNASQVGSVNPLYDLASPEYGQKIRDLKAELSNHSGALQAYDWDSNCVVSVSATEPDRIISAKLIGASRPDSLNFANYLQAPFAQAMGNMFSRASKREGGGFFDASDYANPKSWADSSVFFNFSAAYVYYEKLKKVPGIDELFASALKALKIKTLADEGVGEFELVRTNNALTIYPGLSADLKVKPDVSSGALIVDMLIDAATHAMGGSRSNLSVYAAKNNMELEDMDRFFDPAQATNFHEFSKLYNWFGGQVFYQAVRAMLALKDSDIQNVDMKAATNNLRFNLYMTEVLPFCHMVGKYIMPEKRDKIIEEAEKIKEENLHPTASESDLNIAGSREGMMLFPHQAEALTILKSHPRFAVLDIGAGGGKTTIGIADIAMLLADGLIKRPFIFCPNGLVRNWIDDCHKHMQGRWNLIPVTTETYNSWGDARLTKMIKEAPPNTIVVVGNSFISNRTKVPFVVGNNVEFMSDSVEFCKKFEPDYFFIDESHRLKSTASGIHKGIKTITQLTSVKYGRIGTGTLVQNVLSDVVGQAALYSGQIFRTKDDFDTANKVAIEGPNGRVVQDYDSDAPVRARQRLSEFAAVLSYKRKEWAFMLPLPIETFISVSFEEGSEGSHEYELGKRHQMLYDAVLKQTLKEIQQNREIMGLQRALNSGAVDEDEEDGDDDGNDAAQNHKLKTAHGVEIDVTEGDDDSDNLDALESALQPYLQRLERLLTDPFGDEDLKEVAEEVFKGVDASNFVPAKIRKIIERIVFHFKKNEWKKGSVYHPNAVVDFGSQSFILRPDKPKSGEYKSVIAPNEDTENWKPQIRGKVMVFCRYTRSVDAIFRHLPSDLRKRAVKFHGEIEGNKWDELERFKSDPKIDILIANEQGISEGHNLQVASRFIRAESPWAPGELDQSAARIFRPDVREDGKMLRASIFLDWVICDNTLEVAKMGRLISKMLRKTQFDEANNSKYYKDLNPLNLPIIRMTLDNIKELNQMSDLCSIGGMGGLDDIHQHSYIGQYQYLVGETSEEFHEMRKTKRSAMIPIEPTKMPPEAKTLDYVPWVANQAVPDLKGEGLKALTKVLESDDDALSQEFKVNKNVLIGKIVRTQFGLGKIVKINTKRGKSASGINVLNSLNVELLQGGLENLKASGVYLATKLTEAEAKRSSRGGPNITDDDKRRTRKYGEKRDEQDERADRESRKLGEDVKRNINRTRRTTKPEVEAEVDERTNVELYAVVYNQYLAVEAINPEGQDLSKQLKPYDFKSFGNYAYMAVPNYKTFTDVLAWFDSKFTLDAKTEKILDKLHDNFQTGRGRKFAVELSQPSTLPLFYRQMHRRQKVTNTRRPEIRVYPVIMDGKLMLVIDIATNPVIVKYVGKQIPGTTAKLLEADGLHAAFFSRKSDLVSLYRQMREDGFNITNLSEFKASLKELNLAQTKL